MSTVVALAHGPSVLLLDETSPGAAGAADLRPAAWRLPREQRCAPGACKSANQADKIHEYAARRNLQIVEREMGNLQEQFKLAEQSYGQDILNLVRISVNPDSHPGGAYTQSHGKYLIGREYHISYVKTYPRVRECE